MLSPSSRLQSGLVLLAGDAAQGLGVPAAWASFDRIEVIANVVIVLPLGLLALLSFPRPGWRGWTAYAFLAAVAVELLQGFVLPAREASASDVVANTLGACLGALLGAGLTGRRERTDSSSPPIADDTQ